MADEKENCVFAGQGHNNLEIVVVDMRARILHASNHLKIEINVPTIQSSHSYSLELNSHSLTVIVKQ